MYEREIEVKTCAYARSYEMLAYKFSSPQQRAVPDRLIIHQGLTFFIEFKRTGAKPTASQIREHAKIRQHGIPVFVIDNIKSGRTLLDLIAKGTPLKNINRYGAYQEDETPENSSIIHLPKKGG